MGCGHSSPNHDSVSSRAEGTSIGVTTAALPSLDIGKDPSTAAPQSPRQRVGERLVVGSDQQPTRNDVAHTPSRNSSEASISLLDRDLNLNDSTGAVGYHEEEDDDPVASLVAMCGFDSSAQSWCSSKLSSGGKGSKNHTNSSTLWHDNRTPFRADLFHALGELSGGEMASLFPVMRGNNDKEGSLSQCGVLFEGLPAPAAEAAKDPLNNGTSPHILCGSGFGRTLDGINQSLVSNVHFNGSTAPDSFSSVAEQRTDPSSSQLRLCAFGGL